MKRIALVVLLLLPAGSVLPDEPTRSVPALPGTTWHTVHIDSDALFFVIDDIGIRFENDGRFAVRVRFVDGQQAVRTGKYRVEGGTIFVTIPGIGKLKEVQYWTDGEDLIAHDKAYDVTVRLGRGKMEKESWF